MGRFRVGAAASVVSFVLAGSAGAAQLKITDVKAYAFLEHAGKLSDDLVSSGESLVDAPKGGALGGDTATGLLIDFTFEATRTLRRNMRPQSSTSPRPAVPGSRSPPTERSLTLSLALTGLSTKRSSWRARLACRSPFRFMRERPKSRPNSISTARKPSPLNDAVGEGNVISPCSTPIRPPSNKARVCGPSPT
jgi:hypothetical protein